MLSRLAPVVQKQACRLLAKAPVPIMKSTDAIVFKNITSSAKLNARFGVRKAQVNTQTVRGTSAITVGQVCLAGASVAGIGALCYYGVYGQEGIIDKATMWPKYIRDRVTDTYMYFGGSLISTAAAAVAISRNPSAMRLVSKNGILSLVLTMGAMIGTSVLCRGIEYKPGFGPKQMTWLLHTAVVGAVIAPLTILGGPLLIRAAWYTAGVVGGLSSVAVCAPSDKFLSMGGPLAAGLGVVFVASLGSAFLPPTGALGLGLYSLSMYGGLILFSGFLLYDTQRIVRMAELHPTYGVRPYDPVNASMSIYMDTINIFVRIAMLMAGGNRRK